MKQIAILRLKFQSSAFVF